MKKGDKAMIYENPLTEEHAEGMATLLLCENENAGIYDGRVVQHWTVQFDKNSEPVFRVILSNESI